jgi:hypothetical protein
MVKGRDGGKMTQIMYAHVNTLIIIIKDLIEFFNALLQFTSRMSSKGRDDGLVKGALPPLLEQGFLSCALVIIGLNWA